MEAKYFCEFGFCVMWADYFWKSAQQIFFFLFNHFLNNSKTASAEHVKMYCKGSILVNIPTSKPKC